MLEDLIKDVCKKNIIINIEIKANQFLSNQIEKHKKVVKYTFPIWLYVFVSGVIVYFMISPYYVQ